MAKGNIILHPEKGVNPFLTICKRCGQDAPDLILVGNKQYKDICRNCGAVYYGGRDRPHTGKCNFCDDPYPVFDREPIKDGEKIPIGLCRECQEEEERFAKIVSEGGIYFRCKDCKSTGVIRKNEYTDAVRQMMGKEYTVEPYLPCGVELDARDCLRCSGDA